MRIRSASDLTYTVIAWLPVLAIAAAALWFVAFGMLNLEMRSFGTEFFIGNDATSNMPEGVGPSDEQLLMAALDSGDVDQMSAALDEVEARQAARLAPVATTR